jgi:hypothetical protein
MELWWNDADSVDWVWGVGGMMLIVETGYGALVE